MSVRIINIAPEYERILYFLYPSYSFSSDIRSISNFIAHRDISSKAEKDAVMFRYSNCIFISRKLFDEVWDETVIREEVLKFCRSHFKCRKRILDIPTSPTFIDDLINFMFLSDSGVVEDRRIFELFSNFGSQNFNRVFVKLSEEIPVPVLISSMSTFLSRIIQEDSSSLFYKKKSILFNNKIRASFISALDSYSCRIKDVNGLSFIKFCNDLVL